MGTRATLPVSAALLRAAKAEHLGELFLRIGHDLRGQTWLIDGMLDGTMSMPQSRRHAIATRTVRRTLHVADLCSRVGDALTGFVNLDLQRYSIGDFVAKIDDEHLAIAPSKTRAFHERVCAEAGVVVDLGMFVTAILELLPDDTRPVSVDVRSDFVVVRLDLVRVAADSDLRLRFSRALLEDLANAVGGAFDGELSRLALPIVTTG